MSKSLDSFMIIQHPVVKELAELRRQYRDIFGNRDRDFFAAEEGEVLMEVNEGGGGNLTENITNPKIAQLLADLLNFISS